jgi:hypothetical protein
MEDTLDADFLNKTSDVSWADIYASLVQIPNIKGGQKSHGSGSQNSIFYLFDLKTPIKHLMNINKFIFNLKIPFNYFKKSSQFKNNGS